MQECVGSHQHPGQGHLALHVVALITVVTDHSLMVEHDF